MNEEKTVKLSKILNTTISMLGKTKLKKERNSNWKIEMKERF